MSRKTVDVADLIAMVNIRLATPDSTLYLKGLTVEQAFRLSAASVLEQVLHATDNYHGFKYQPSEWDAERGCLKSGMDGTRRIYYAP